MGSDSGVLERYMPFPWNTESGRDKDHDPTGLLAVGADERTAA